MYKKVIIMHQHKTVEFPFAKIVAEKRNFIVVYFEKNCQIEKEEALKIMSQLLILSEGLPFVNLAHLSGTNNYFTKEALNIIANDKKTRDTWLAEALILNSLPHRVLAILYNKLHFKPKKITKIFAAEKNARAWLNKMIDNHEF